MASGHPKTPPPPPPVAGPGFHIIAKREHSAAWGGAGRARGGAYRLVGPAGAIYHIREGDRDAFRADGGMLETFEELPDATAEELLALQAEEREQMTREAAEAEAARVAAEAAEQERQARSAALRDLARRAVRGREDSGS